ncbi:MAG: hypothetical protein M3Z05_12940 [Gemmatimonadota bacterium]|nr:hypothetical protein [Gemmatimonadota bacterium]
MRQDVESFGTEHGELSAWSTASRPWRRQQCLLIRLLLPFAIHAAAALSLAAQAQPAGKGRLWAELGLAAAQQLHRCVQCDGAGTAVGPAVTLSVGHTLASGFGVAFTGLAFHELSFETSFHSEYLAALVQYSPLKASVLTLSAGAGWGKHEGDSSPGLSNGNGSVVVGSASLRLPPASMFAASLSASVFQSIDGTPRRYLRLMSVGIAIALASDADAVGPREAASSP